ncbi:MAG: hypothetical protein DRH20_15160 [Deltaproteobacteria bacterium]|nr:MAG: hypothetical protein DRH20_15160 [Deltaproteobacteria bacterium]
MEQGWGAGKQEWYHQGQAPMMVERWKLFKGAKSLFSAKDLSGSGGGTGWAAETGSPPGWEAFFRFGPAEWKGCLQI